jgi:hypothetical protein
MDNKPENWAAMTPEEKRTWRLELYRNSGKNVKFVSKQAEKNYNTRVNRQIAVYNVEKPDRIPLSISAGNLPLQMAGLENRTAYYEPEKAYEAAMKFNEKYSDELESFSMPMSFSGEVMDILGYKLYAWPGGGLPNNAGGFQFREGEYMTADEYDDLIRDPSDFWLRKYLPRVFGSFVPFTRFASLTNIIEAPGVNDLAVPFSEQPVMDMFETFIKAGHAFRKHSAGMMKYMGIGASKGYPAGMMGGFCFAPFDILGDTMRGTTNIMKDMYRRPQKLLAALEVITDITIDNVLKMRGSQTGVSIMYPLHKGADGWMSKAMFDKFYWPTLKRCMDAFIKEGLVQYLFAEGAFNTRLDSVGGFPKGSVSWLFDQTDMVKAKKALGKECCIAGNVPSSLLVTSTPEEVKKYCRNLIETVGQDGGYVLSPGATPDNPKIENLKAMVEVVNEYGWYK